MLGRLTVGVKDIGGKLPGKLSIGKADASFSRLEDEVESGGSASFTSFRDKAEEGVQEIKKLTTESLKSPEAARMERILDGAAKRAEGLDPRVAPLLKYVRPALTCLCQGLCICLPLYFKLLRGGYWFWTTYIAKSAQLVKMVLGVVLCFFGGTFVATIAAAEALQQFGTKQAIEDLRHVFAQASRLQDANDKDDKVDEDGDGVSDMDQLLIDKPQEWARRKLYMGLTVVDDPQRLSSALRNLWSAYLAVIATLRLEFARTTAIALGIVEVVSPVVKRTVYEPLIALIGTGLKQWADVAIDAVLGLIAITIAWYIQMVIAMYYSALRGGQMFANALFELLNLTGYVKHLGRVPGLSLDEQGNLDPADTIIDEVIGYTLAGCGMLYQVQTGFHLPFPINLLLAPVSILEAYLRVQISAAALGSAAGAATPDTSDPAGQVSG